MLRFFDGRTQSEIAAELGISQMHVSRLLARTLAQLRTGLLTDDDAADRADSLGRGLSAAAAPQRRAAEQGDQAGDAASGEDARAAEPDLGPCTLASSQPTVTSSSAEVTIGARAQRRPPTQPCAQTSSASPQPTLNPMISPR